MDLPLILATVECRTAGHQIAEGHLLVGDEARELAEPVCITCTEAQGYVRGLKAWRDACPCCFSHAHPQGIPQVRPVRTET
jgi:hypothetical protein